MHVSFGHLESPSIAHRRLLLTPYPIHPSESIPQLTPVLPALARVCSGTSFNLGRQDTPRIVQPDELNRTYAGRLPNRRILLPRILARRTSAQWCSAPSGPWSCLASQHVAVDAHSRHQTQGDGSYGHRSCRVPLQLRHAKCSSTHHPSSTWLLFAFPLQHDHTDCVPSYRRHWTRAC